MWPPPVKFLRLFDILCPLWHGTGETRTRRMKNESGILVSSDNFAHWCPLAWEALVSRHCSIPWLHPAPCPGQLFLFLFRPGQIITIIIIWSCSPSGVSDTRSFWSGLVFIEHINGNESPFSSHSLVSQSLELWTDWVNKDLMLSVNSFFMTLMIHLEWGLIWRLRLTHNIFSKYVCARIMIGGGTYMGERKPWMHNAKLFHFRAEFPSLAKEGKKNWIERDSRSRFLWEETILQLR